MLKNRNQKTTKQLKEGVLMTAMETKIQSVSELLKKMTGQSSFTFELKVIAYNEQIKVLTIYDNQYIDESYFEYDEDKFLGNDDLFIAVNLLKELFKKIKFFYTPILEKSEQMLEYFKGIRMEDLQ